jgi:hypothetical protein
MQEPAMETRPIARSAAAGLAYFAIVFAAGFVLGALRVLVLIPRLGDGPAAVLLELPVMLALSWMACRRLVARFDVPAAPVARLMMGGLAFAALMAAELGVSVFGFGRSLSEHLASYRQLPASLGLAGQIVFAALPMVQSFAGRRSAAARGRSALGRSRFVR